MNRIVASLFFIAFSFSAYAQQGTVTGPFAPCSVFGTTSGTCLQGAGPLGSPSSVGTLPAFTVGGTVSGGGNQINNVIIGTSTPLAGTFTALQANTSANVGAAIAPDALFTVNANTGATLAGPSPTVLHGIGGDGLDIWLTMDAFGGAARIAQRRANGTLASKTAVASGDVLGTIVPYGWDGSAYSFGANFQFVAAENYGANRGTYWRLFTTPVGSSTIAEAVRINASGGFSVGTTTDPGIGSIQVNTTIVAPNITSDAGLTDTTLCWKNSATTGTFLKGSGTLGICLGTSGAQFKTAFEPLVAGIDEIARLRLWNYRYLKGFGDSGERVQYGPTAQDVETVLPDLVRYDEHGEAINYDIGAFLPIALHALQQLKTDNDNLRSCQGNWKCRIFGIRG